MLQRRREEAAALAGQARRARRLTRQRLAPITMPGAIEDVTPPVVRDVLAARRPRQRAAALDLLDLGDRIDTPTIGQPDDDRAAGA